MTAERAPLARAGLDDEYELIRELGVGGTAVVYLARRRSTGEEVAIKLIRAAYLEDEEALARFAREARFAARLDHPNIVPIREVLPLGGGGVALIMAHVAGRTLKQFIRDEAPLSPATVEHILREVAAALGEAHALDIVHRDVKPENIFIDQGGHALLADFGLARSTAGDAQLTMSGIAIGTPTYMPPEQIDGASLDARGDIYSLGLVGWEMLTGRRPWDGDSLYALLYHQKHDYLPDVRELRPDVSDSLAGVIATAIEKEPDARWQNIAEFIAALDGAVPGRGHAPHTPVSSDTVRISRATLEPVAQSGATATPAAGEAAIVGAVAGASATAIGGTTGRPTPSAARAPRVFIPAAPPPVEVEEPEVPERPARRFLVPGLVTLGIVVLLLGAFGLHSWLDATAKAEEARYAAMTNTAAGTLPNTPTPAPAPVPAAPAATPGGAGPLPTATSGAAPITAPVDPRRLRDSIRLARRADSAAAARASSTVDDSRRTAALSATPPPPAPRSRVRTSAPASPAPVNTGAATSVAASTAAPANGPSSAPTSGAAGNAGSSNATPSAAATPAAARATIVAGGMHSCLISAGHGYCWGANTRGQLGSTAASRSASPTPIGGGLELTTIAAGLSHSCALVRGGAAWCWGENDHGQLGDRSNTGRTAPVRAAEGRSFRAITAGASHTCGLENDGSVWCWGGGSHGELGNGSTRDSNVPVAASSAHYAAVSAGWNFTCALDASGHASCWGENDAGQLGTRDTTDRAQPTPVATDVAFVAIAAGNAHACALTAQGEAYCWGRNSSGQLGDGTTSSHQAPTRVHADAHFTSITAGAVHTCATTTNGDVFCWGQNTYGQLGTGGGGNQSQPARVAGGHDFASVRAFGSHTCGTTVSGDAFCWGYNLEGQLGDGTRINRTRPVYVEPPTGR